MLAAASAYSGQQYLTHGVTGSPELVGEIVIPPSARSHWLRLSKYEVAAMAAWLSLRLSKGHTPALTRARPVAPGREGGSP